MFAGLAGTQIWIPYGHTGLIINFYRSNLFLRLKFDFNRGLRRWRREFSCFRFCLVWFDQVNLLPRVIPSCLVDWWNGISLLLIFSGGHSLLFIEKFTSVVFSSLILIFQFLAQDSILFRCEWKSWDAILEILFDESIAVSSVNEVRRIWFVVDISAVKIL
jgi:hypothetical protein